MNWCCGYGWTDCSRSKSSSSTPFRTKGRPGAFDTHSLHVSGYWATDIDWQGMLAYMLRSSPYDQIWWASRAVACKEWCAQRCISYQCWESVGSGDPAHLRGCRVLKSSRQPRETKVPEKVLSERKGSTAPEMVETVHERISFLTNRKHVLRPVQFGIKHHIKAAYNGYRGTIHHYGVDLCQIQSLWFFQH